MKQKKFILSLILALGLMFYMSLVLGAITFISPDTAGDTVTGATQLFNFTIAGDSTDVTGALNITASTTDDGVFYDSLNDSASQTTWNFTFDTTSLTDAEDTTLAVNISNATASTYSTLTINVDNTAPVCAFTVDKDIIEILNGLGIETTQSSTDATTDLTYSWILYRSDNTQSQTSTSSAPTFSGTDLDQIGEFTLALTVTDEASQSTACTNQSITITGSDGTDVGIIVATQQGIFERIGTPVVVIGVVILLIIISTIIVFALSGGKR